MTGQPTAATAIALVREALRDPPPAETADPVHDLEELLARSVEWERFLLSAVEHYTEEQRVSLIGLLARLGSWLALEIPAQRRELFLSLMAGNVDVS